MGGVFCRVPVCGLLSSFGGPCCAAIIWQGLAECAHGARLMIAALLPKARAGYHPVSPWRRRYTVALVSVMTALLCADQNLLAPNVRAAVTGLASACDVAESRAAKPHHA
jgi:hypothetical protein